MTHPNRTARRTWRTGLAGITLPALVLAGCAGSAQPPTASETPAAPVAHAVPEASPTFNPAPVAISDAAAAAAAPTADPGETVVAEADPSAAAVSFVATSEAPASETWTAADAGAPPTRPLLFATGAAEVGAEDMDLIAAHAEHLAEHPSLRLRVTGHADPRGPAALNRILSEQRAHEVARLLKARGVAAERILVEAHGAEQPLGDDHRASRRVVLEYLDHEPRLSAR